MAIHISQLPPIVDCLVVDSAVHFVVLRYPDFVNLCRALPPEIIPDVSSVLDWNDEHTFVVLLQSELRDCIRKAEVVGNINERAYLRKHPDVAEAVQRGQIDTATKHYLVQGYFERRVANFDR